MKGCTVAYCNAVINALLAAAGNLMQTSVREALSVTPYGKRDTLGFDAIPEIEIINHISQFDPNSILVTEELGRDVARHWPVHSDPTQQPIIFFCDPTDRSSELKRFLETFMKTSASAKVGDLIRKRSTRKKWDAIGGPPSTISGATSAITCVRRGVAIFSVIFNYITWEIFLACSAGIYRYTVSSEAELHPNKVTVEDIITKGKQVVFPSVDEEQATTSRWDAWKTFITFLGKSGYKENFADSMIFIEENTKHLYYDRPGGPARALYLSDLQSPKQPIGFILANGEKIGEWIHWLPFVNYAYYRGERSLTLFEIFHERPWTKQGILMSTSPAYSIFQPKDDGEMLIDVSQLARFHNPSLFRETLLVAPSSNEWVLHTMHQHQYRKINLAHSRPV